MYIYIYIYIHIGLVAHEGEEDAGPEAADQREEAPNGNSISNSNLIDILHSSSGRTNNSNRSSNTYKGN